jgi:predicted site-specific integrase-resolvase
MEHTVEEPLWDQEETAAHLSINARTLEGWRYTGRVELPYVKIGRAVRYRPEDVRAFKERQLRVHTGQLAPYAGHPKLR